MTLHEEVCSGRTNDVDSRSYLDTTHATFTESQIAPHRLA
jgi:hypothetical protein